MTKKLAIFENDDSYINNTATYGNEFAAYPIRMILSSYFEDSSNNLTQNFCNISSGNYSDQSANNFLYYDSEKCNEMFKLNNETPGVLISTLMRFNLVDYLNQTVYTQNGGLCIIEVKATTDFQNIEGSVYPNLIGFTTTTLVAGYYILIFIIFCCVRSIQFFWFRIIR